MPPFRIPVVVALAGLALASSATVGSVAATTPARMGTVSGTVSGSLPKAGQGRVIVTAIDAASGAVADMETADGKGRFALSVGGGAYAVTTTVVRPQAAVVTQSAAVSVKAGKTRRKVALKVKKPKSGTAPAKKSLASVTASRTSAGATLARDSASRSFVTERGKGDASVTAYKVEEFTGAPAEYSNLNRGLSNMLATDLFIGDKCGMKQVVGEAGRTMIKKELDFQKSGYTDKNTRVKRDFIIADVSVGGTIAAGPSAGTVAVRVVLTDTRTGGTISTVDATMRVADLFTDQDQLAKAVSERLCRRPASYDVALKINGIGEFATHSTAGAITTNVIALSGGAAPPTTWVGNGTYVWDSLTFASKTECSYLAPIPGAGTWQATVAFVSDQQVRVDWSTGNDGPGAISTASVSCPKAGAIPGQPGPNLVTTSGTNILLPIGGGTAPVTGGFISGGDGWTNTGTLTLTPVWGQQGP